jgi:hypothetical protein
LKLPKNSKIPGLACGGTFKTKLSSTLASLFTIISNCTILYYIILFFLLNLNGPQKIHLLNIAMLLNRIFPFFSFFLCNFLEMGTIFIFIFFTFLVLLQKWRSPTRRFSQIWPQRQLIREVKNLRILFPCCWRITRTYYLNMAISKEEKQEKKCNPNPPKFLAIK